MSRIEDHIINNLDSQRIPTQTEIGERGKIAERVVIEFLRSTIGMDVRPATPLEDSGIHGIVQEKAIDAVGYLDGRPAIALQITTANNKGVRHEKATDLLNRPFVRLSEMTAADTAVPRVLVFVNNEEVQKFLIDHKIERHQKLAGQIIEGVLNSLKLDLMKTKNPKEQELIQKLMILFTESKKFF